MLSFRKYSVGGSQKYNLKREQSATYNWQNTCSDRPLVITSNNTNNLWSFFLPSPLPSHRYQIYLYLISINDKALRDVINSHQIRNPQSHHMTLLYPIFWKLLFHRRRFTKPPIQLSPHESLCPSNWDLQLSKYNRCFLFEETNDDWLHNSSM